MIETILAYGFTALAVLMSLTFAWIRHPIHAALSFACAVISAAGICLLQDAAFVAASLVIVYAGATIIIFLFALMFAHQAKLSEYDLRMENPFLALLAATGLMVALVLLINQGVVAKESQTGVPVALAVADVIVDAGDASSTANADLQPDAAADQSKEPAGKPASGAESKPTPNPDPAASSQVAMSENSAQPVAKPTENRAHLAAFGREFYTRYLLAVEIAGTLLLVATIGSVLIAQRDDAPHGMRDEVQ